VRPAIAVTMNGMVRKVRRDHAMMFVAVASAGHPRSSVTIALQIGDQAIAVARSGTSDLSPAPPPAAAIARAPLAR